jgi:probable F420-dependent oxidoreductase
MKVDAAFPLTGELDTRRAAAAAEAADYAGFWTTEVKHDPFVGLTLAATATERIELGTAIAVAFARNPMSMAAVANDLQLLSKGRLLLGLGSQVKAHITRRFNMPWSHPAPRMREYILALRAIWDTWHKGTPLEFKGEFYTHTLMTPFFDPGRNEYGAPKVLVAGVGGAMTAVAGEVADGFLCHGFTTERYLREVTIPALKEGRAKAGKDLDGFEVCGTPFIVTGRDDEEMAKARAGVKQQIAFYGSTPAYHGVLEAHGWHDLGHELHGMSRNGQWQEMAARIDDDVVDAFAVVAAPDKVGAELVQRFGDVVTRMTFYTPYAVDNSVTAQIAADVQAASS